MLSLRPTVLKRLLWSLTVISISLGLGLFLYSKYSTPISAAAGGEIPIHIVGNGWHAGIVVPAHAFASRLPTLQQRFPQASHYEIGWGDTGFYRASDVTAALALQALFASRGSVLHVVGVPRITAFLKGSDVASLCVSQQAYAQIVQTIADSFERTPENQPVDAGPGIYGDSQFYLAKGQYSALNTCNRWTASVLASAGIEISPRLSLTASSVLGAARRSIHACQTPVP